MDLLLLLASHSLLLSIGVLKISGKYLEGELQTGEVSLRKSLELFETFCAPVLQNWAFLGRFCFLSEDGEFEYRIEFSEEMGVPNLLLYYDSDDQWPAIYKTTKVKVALIGSS